MFRADRTPLTPSGPQARELLRPELAKSEYHQPKSLLQTVLDWIGRQLGDLLSGSTGTLPAIAWLIGLLLVVLLAVLAAIGLRRGRVRARTTTDAEVLGEQAVTAAELRRRATGHERDGDFGPAAIDYFRAIAVRGVERALVDPAPGLTAHDIALVLGRRFPGSGTDLFDAAASFDAILYGDQAADADICSRTRELEKHLADSRPAAPASQLV